MLTPMPPPYYSIAIIVAYGDNYVIGDQNKLCWHIPEDLKRFKALTTQHRIIMGRKTFDSIGRPLPLRDNVIISRDKSLTILGCTVVESLDAALALPLHSNYSAEQIFIIGGGQIYRDALPIADRLYVTKVDIACHGDTFFPSIDPAEWQEESCELHHQLQPQELTFQFITYNRKAPI